MELTPYTDALRAQLAAIAAVGGPEATALAERLGDALEVAARLALQSAIADAAAEISRNLAPGSVEVRLRGQELELVTTSPSTIADTTTATPTWPVMAPQGGAATGEAADSGTARINFRPSEQLKARIEQAADRAGMSVNAFLVATVSAALDAPAPSAARGFQVTGWYA